MDRKFNRKQKQDQNPSNVGGGDVLASVPLVGEGSSEGHQGLVFCFWNVKVDEAAEKRLKKYLAYSRNSSSFHEDSCLTSFLSLSITRAKRSAES